MAEGIGIADERGLEALYCVASVQHRSVYAAQSGATIILVPGHVNEWNDIIVDLTRVPDGVAFHPGPDGFVTFQLMVATDGSRIGDCKASADFAKPFLRDRPE
jgi:hypothetical protein